MKAKKMISGILAVLMALSVIGCAKGGENKAASIVKLAENSVYPITSEDSITIWTPMDIALTTKFSNFGETELAKELEKRTGVKVTYIHPAVGQENEQFNLMVASNELADVVRYDWQNFGAQAAIENGYIIELNESIDKWAPGLKKVLSENKKIDKMIKTDTGSYYVFPLLRSESRDTIYSGAIVRKDWLDQLGLEVPETIDEWDNMFRRFKNELNVDFPGGIRSSHIDRIFAGAYGVGVKYYIDDESGAVQFGPAEDAYKDFLTQMNIWYKDGLLDKNLASLDNQTLESNMLNDRVGATFGAAAGALGKWMSAKTPTDPEFELVGAPYPVINKGDKAKFSSRSWEYVPSSSYAVSARCKNPELAIRFMDYGYTEEGSMLYNFGIEGVTYEMMDNYPKFTKKITESPEGFSAALAPYAMGSDSGPFVQDTRVVEQMQAKPKQVRAAVLTWADTEAEKTLMPLVSLTAEEQSELSNIISEIDTFSTEMMLKFIVGTEPLENFEQYQEQLKKFNLDRAIEIYTAAVERYNKR